MTATQWFLIGLAVIVTAIVIILVVKGRQDAAAEGRTPGNIRGIREGMGAPDPRPSVRPSLPRGGSLQYDSKGRLVAWERWEPDTGFPMFLGGGGASPVILLPDGRKKDDGGEPAEKKEDKKPAKPAPEIVER